MSYLHLLIDGFITAGELAALLFVTPASALEPARAEPSRQLAMEAPALSLPFGSLDTIQFDGCEDEESDDGVLSPGVGHVRLEIDELIADAALSTVTAPHALLVDQPGAYFLVVVPPSERAAARLTLRPLYLNNEAVRTAHDQTIELGEPSQPSERPVVYVVRLADRAALQALVAGAIELETRTADVLVWSTLTTQVRSDTGLALLNFSR